MWFDGHLVEKLGTAPKLNLTKSYFFEISTSNLEQQNLQIFGFDFLAVLEWNMFCKIYILYEI